MGGLSSFGFVAGTAVFVLTLVACAVGGVWRGTETTRKFYGIMALAAGVLAIVYAASWFGIGVRGVQDPGRTIYALRYAGWLVATPLVLVALWWLAGGDGRVIVPLVGLDAFAVLAAATGALASPVVAGVVAGVVDAVVAAVGARIGAGGSAGFTSWVGAAEARLALIAVAAISLLGVVGVVFRVLSPRAGRQPGEVGILFSILRNLLALFWVGYAGILVVGPGLELVGQGVETVAVTLLDVGLVVVFGAVLLHDDETLATADTGRTLVGRSVAELRAKIEE